MKATTTISLQQARQPCDGVICDQLANNERLRLLIDVYFLMQSGLVMQAEPRQAELLHSLTVKLTETFLPALRQAAQEEAGGVRKGTRRSVLAVCPLYRIDDEQHVDTVPLTMSIHTSSTQGIAVEAARRHRVECAPFVFL